MFEKLKREWKTAALAVATTLVGIWDAGASAYDWSPVVPDKWKPYLPLFLGLGFIALRRWTDGRRC